MRPRQITTHGWCVEDDLRADRIAQERARPWSRKVVILDEVDSEPWRADKTPYMADLMKTYSPDNPVVKIFFRPSAGGQSKTWKDEP